MDVCIRIHIHLLTIIFACIWTCIRICTCSCLCMCTTYTYVCVYIDIGMSVCLCVCMSLCLYVCMHAFMHACRCIQLYRNDIMLIPDGVTLYDIALSNKHLTISCHITSYHIMSHEFIHFPFRLARSWTCEHINTSHAHGAGEAACARASACMRACGPHTPM